MQATTARAWRRKFSRRSSQSSRVNAPAYGADDYTARAQARLDEIFERRVAAFLVATGTAANALALGALVRPWETVFCHEEAHIQEDECGAPEFFTAGGKLVGIPGLAGKIAPEALRETLARFPRGQVKTTQPGALSLSQASEAGTIYRPEEIAALAVDRRTKRASPCTWTARASPMRSSRPASRRPRMTWRAGVDALSFGATKNGALACEAVIFFDPDKAAGFAYQRKRAGQTLSKGRFLGAQMEAYLTDGLWLDLARRANAAARASLAGARYARRACGWRGRPRPTKSSSSRRANSPRRGAPPARKFHDWTSRSIAPERGAARGGDDDAAGDVVRNRASGTSTR